METDLFLYRPDGTRRRVRGTGNGSLYTVARIPDYVTLVNEGKVFEFLDTTTTVALVARPTVTASLTVQNPAGNDKLVVVFGILMYTDVVPATLGTVTVWHCIHKLTTAAFTRDLVLTGTGAGTAGCLKAGVNYNGQLIVDRGATVVDDGWTPTPLNLVSNIATTNFEGAAARLMAPVIIPPAYHYSLQTTATVVTFESALGLIFAEVDLTDLA